MERARFFFFFVWERLSRNFHPISRVALWPNQLGARLSQDGGQDCEVFFVEKKLVSISTEKWKNFMEGKHVLRSEALEMLNVSIAFVRAQRGKWKEDKRKRQRGRRESEGKKLIPTGHAEKTLLRKSHQRDEQPHYISMGMEECFKSERFKHEIMSNNSRFR